MISSNITVVLVNKN